MNARRLISESRLRWMTDSLERHGYPSWAKERVYFAADARRSLIKIGSSKDVGRRLVELQAAHGPIGLIASVPGTRDVERLIQQRFSNLHVGHEWFLPALPITRLALVLARAKSDSLRVEVLAKLFGCRPNPMGTARPMRCWL